MHPETEFLRLKAAATIGSRSMIGRCAGGLILRPAMVDIDEHPGQHLAD